MARQPRLAFDDAIVWVTASTRENALLFESDVDYQEFLTLIARVLDLRGVRLAAWTLVPREYHLVLRGSSAAIARSMQDINSAWSRQRGRNEGGIFKGRYRAVVVEPGTYLTQLVAWMFNLPMRAGLAESAARWRWSAYRDLVRARRASFSVAGADLMENLGAGHGTAVRHLRTVVAQDARTPWEPRDHILRQRILGGRAFAGALLSRTPAGEPAPPKAEDVLDMVSSEWLMSRDELRHARGGEARAVAALLMRETGERLTMIGSWLGVSESGASRLASKAQTLVEDDAVLAEKVKRLRKRLAGGASAEEPV